MPKQKIHEGRTYSLIPLKEPSGDIAVGEDGLPTSHWYKSGFTDIEESNRLLGTMDPKNYLLNDHEPHAYLTWSKRHADAGNGDPNDQGFVYVSLEVSPEWMRKELRRYDAQFAAGMKGDSVFLPEPNIEVAAGALGWQDINALIRSAKQARDDAFGKPE